MAAAEEEEESCSGSAAGQARSRELMHRGIEGLYELVRVPNERSFGGTVLDMYAGAAERGAA